MPLDGLPSPTVIGTLRRALKTSVVVARVLLLLARDRARGPLEPAQIGRRVAEGLRRLGATAIKLGQQLSMRADLLPPELTRELESLTDRVPPLAWEQVPALLSAELGRPLEEVFQHIDPQPIGAASLACVYKATLLDGREVAVKVQRPGVARAFSEDLAVLAGLTHALEALAIVPSGFFRSVRFDMKMMFSEELDFRLEARYQRTFRRILRAAKLRWASAPRVISELCTKRLLVTELVRGVSGRAVIAAVEGGDHASLAAWGINPARLGRRIFRFSAWARLQALMLHVDPHPGNMLILPGDRVTFIDFGACGPASRRSHRNHREVLRLIMLEDASAIARIMLNDVAPIPYLDQASLLRDIEAGFGRFIRALHAPDSHWSERILAGLWMDMLESTRKHNIQLNLDTIRSMRAFMLYDTVAYRINPEMDTRELKTSLREIDGRDGRAAEGRLGALRSGGEELRGQIAELLERGRAVAAALEPTLSSVSALLEAARRVRDNLLRQVARGLFALGAGLMLWGGLRALALAGISLPSPWQVSPHVLSGVWALVGLAVLVRAVRHVLFDLNRLET